MRLLRHLRRGIAIVLLVFSAAVAATATTFGINKRRHNTRVLTVLVSFPWFQSKLGAPIATVLVIVSDDGSLLSCTVSVVDSTCPDATVPRANLTGHIKQATPQASAGGVTVLLEPSGSALLRRFLTGIP